MTSRKQPIYEEACEEVDEPFTNGANHIRQLSPEEVKRDESSKERQFRRTLQIKGLGFLYFTLAAILFLYVVDVFLVNFFLKNSSLLSSIYDILKFLASSLIGFVFAKSTLNDNN